MLQTLKKIYHWIEVDVRVLNKVYAWLKATRWWQRVLILIGLLMLFSVFDRVLDGGPPELRVSKPDNNTVVAERLLEVSGFVDPPTARVMVNNRFMAVDTGGFFTGKINLRGGKNTLRIVAEKKYTSETLVLYVTREITEEEAKAEEAERQVVAEAEAERRRAQAEREREKSARSHTTTAIVCAQNKVESLLKSPSTADFPWGAEAVALGDDNYLVRSYVDSQNSFGATLRTEFICEVIVLDPDNYSCRSECVFDE